MAKRKPLILSPEVRSKLFSITTRRAEKAGEVRRAEILLMYDDGLRIAEIARRFNTNRPLVERTIDRALSIGSLQSLSDLPRPGRPPCIGDDAKAWVLSVACQKPVDLGYANELWTYSLLIKHIKNHCKAIGYQTLSSLGKGRLHAILSKSNIKPHKISYYVERRDEHFEEKMANVLCVYKEVEMQKASKDNKSSVTLSYDEKPGIQAIKNIAPQLQPVPGKHQTIQRDGQYKRLGTVSLLAGIDLHTGRVIPLVRNRHRSIEFIEFLDKLNNSYPESWQIRIVLDNHSAHISKETQKYLRTKPGRFQFVFTPKHGSWLNIIEMFFSKIARSFLRHIRVETKQELIDRIYQGIAQVNEEPVIFKWRYKMDEMATA